MKPYEEIVESWIRNYMETMDDGILSPGDRTGSEPLGIKIIFDGYGDLDIPEQEYVEAGNHSMLSFAVFVHRDSLTQEFPEHEFTAWALLHRPREEVCIWAWYDKEQDSFDIVPFEDGGTEIDHEYLYKLIYNIWKRDNEE